MSNRRYYSVRTGKNPEGARIDLSTLLRLFRDTYLRLIEGNYFQETLGYECIDAGHVHGTLGTDIEAQMFRKLRKPDLWPIHEQCTGYAEDDLFDVIEFLFDNVSKPVDGWFHQHDGCGWHYETFDQQAGRERFRSEVNEWLADYGSGYELSPDGEILAAVEPSLEGLLQEVSNGDASAGLNSLVRSATLKFRRYHSSPDDRRDAVRDLADVLEELRPRLKEVLTEKDESDLFNLANNFGIRHRNDRQKTGYDREIWYSWMFYYYLATINASARLIQRQAAAGLDEIPF